MGYSLQGSFTLQSKSEQSPAIKNMARTKQAIVLYEDGNQAIELISVKGF